MDKNVDEYSNKEILNHYYMCKLIEKLCTDKRSDDYDDIYNDFEKWFECEYNGNVISKKRFRKHFVNNGYKYNGKQNRLIGLKLK